MAERGSGSSRQGKSRRKSAADDAGEQITGTDVRTALIQGQTFAAKPVQYVVQDGLAIFEGDIVLGTEEEMELQTEQLRGNMISGGGMTVEGVMISGAQFRWPDCRIPYTIDPALPNQARVTDAIAHWQAATRYRFVVRTSEPDWVTFRPGSGCSSQVGRRGGQQFVNLGAGCSLGSVIHEIGHVVGLWHEQSREDRDAFVTIHWDKIRPGTEHNFNQHITDGDDIGPYDYGSIMHYPRDAFSVDGSDTITPTDPTAVIGQRAALSPGDIAAANSICPRIGKLPIKDIKEPLKDIKEPRKDFKEPIKDHKEPLKDIKEGPKDIKEPLKDIKEGPKDIKEPPKDRKEAPFDTLKERIKDLRLDTRKEQVLDTLKEGPKDVASDPIKGPAFDPPITKPRDPVVTPGQIVGPVAPPIQPGGRLPFTVGTPHVAPSFEGGGAAGGDLESTVAALDQQLHAVAEQLAQLDAHRTAVQQQYDQLSAALGQALDAADEAQ